MYIFLAVLLFLGASPLSADDTSAAPAKDTTKDSTKDTSAAPAKDTTKDTTKDSTKDSKAAPAGNTKNTAASNTPGGTLQLTDQAELKMVTIFPGRALYSMFGHTAIRVEDPLHGIDLLYNYGQSSVPFDATFIPRFVTGDLPFVLGVIQTPRAYDFYRDYENRTIYEQDLQLKAEERQAIFDYLEVNARPENRTYIYDFFHDNCTTRVRDLFWDIFGEDISFKLPSLPVKSYRNAIAPYIDEKQFVKFGINLMLGAPTDGVPGPDRRLYLPGQLMEALEVAQLKGHPLMGDSRFVYQGRNGTTILPGGTAEQSFLAHLPSILFSPSPLLWIIFAAALLLSLSRNRASRGARAFDALLFALAGIVGIASILLWRFSGYIMTTANYHLLWAWPTHLLLPYFLIKKEKSPILRWYLLISAAALLGTLVLFPFLPQQLPLPAIPLLLTLALRAARHSTPVKVK